MLTSEVQVRALISVSPLPRVEGTTWDFYLKAKAKVWP